jgi:hypothetical protein
MSLLAPTNIAASDALVTLSIGTARYDTFFAMGTTSFAPILLGVSRRPHACYRRLRQRIVAARHERHVAATMGRKRVDRDALLVADRHDERFCDRAHRRRPENEIGCRKREHRAPFG